MGFDYPLVKELLQGFGIPILFVETDSSSRSSAQLKTRLEAFAEILRKGEME
jgi:benzoyl-CoA reductase/2-hydroxyglutaryl-CoA dehydratase subunit BcrC/BadD/HgdB